MAHQREFTGDLDEDDETPARGSHRARNKPVVPDEPTNPWGFAFAVLRTFGFPTMAAIALGWWAYHVDSLNREDRTAQQTAFLSALAKNTDAVVKVQTELHDMNIKLEAHLNSDEVVDHRRPR